MKTAQLATEKSTLELPNFLAANLRALRKSAGWSQTELARRVGLNRGNIASYESGTAEPSICKVLRISKLFDIGARDLIRLDLSDNDELVLARIAYTQEKDDQRDAISKHRQEAMVLGELVRSSRALFSHKKEHLNKPCAEADMFAMQYEQLYQLTDQLLNSYRNLLNDVSCQCDGE